MIICLVVTLHHIASDGWSTSIIVRELVELYRSYEEGREANLKPLTVAVCGFCDMAAEIIYREKYWKRNWITGRRNWKERSRCSCRLIIQDLLFKVQKVLLQDLVLIKTVRIITEIVTTARCYFVHDFIIGI